MQPNADNEGFEVEDQSLISTQIEAFAGIVNMAVASYFFIKLKHARQMAITSSNSSESVFLKSITWAMYSMILSIIVSFVRCLQFIEPLTFNSNILERDFFNCNSESCLFCAVAEQFSQIAIATVISLHFLIFTQSISDSFGEVDFLALSAKKFKLIQVIVIGHALLVITLIIVLIRAKLFSLAEATDVHICMRISDPKLTIAFSTTGVISTLMNIGLLSLFLKKALKVK